MYSASLNTLVLILATLAFLNAHTDSKGEFMKEFKSLQVGMVAPDFTLMDEDGVERNLSDYLGSKNVILAFYPKDFTGG